MSSQHMTEQAKKTEKVAHRVFVRNFIQQELPELRPILTAQTVMLALFLSGLLYISLGVALLCLSNNVQEIQIDYTNCSSQNYDGRLCQDLIENVTIDHAKSTPCICEIQFTLDQTFEKNVYFYYGLDNFYQNHRRYVNSRDDNQLYGKKLASVDSSCAPFDQENGSFFAPCGAIANSLFNDTLQVLDRSHNSDEVKVLKTGIVWPSDYKWRFKNPPGDHNISSKEFAFAGILKPKNWIKHIYELDPNDDGWSNNGYENEDLIVWMRTAAFPSFRKLYRRVDHEQPGFKNGMPQGNYTLRITFSYPVKSFGGRKRFIISNTSFLGNKNDFLGIVYIAFGAIYLLLGDILIIQIKYKKRNVF